VSPAAGPYSPALRVGEWVVTSGQVGIRTKADGAVELVPGGTEAELRQALTNLADVLASQGATLADVRKATVFLTDMGDFGILNDVWVEIFSGTRPARSAIGVAALPLGARVEVEAWAHTGGPSPDGRRG